LLRVLLIVITTASALVAFVGTRAEPLRAGEGYCHAVSLDRATPPGVFHCEGEPRGYERATLWLHADLSVRPVARTGAILLLHTTRFDQMVVLWRYADNAVLRRVVSRGDYGPYWRIGGQIAFAAPRRDAPLASVTLGVTHLASHKLLRSRLFVPDRANRDLAMAALLAGGTLTLLLCGGIYNLSLAVAVRRQFLAWHGLWALCVFLWGVIWSQAALVVLPGIAGTLASQICTFLACTAVGLATMSAISAISAFLPFGLRALAIGIGLLVALAGIPGALATGAAVKSWGSIMAFLTLADLAVVTVCLALAHERGSSESRQLAITWVAPMVTLALTMFMDLDTRLFGGGSQIAVLFASALQGMWLSIAVTRRLASLRVELDAARAAEVALAELANRDPLTGLFNRRGFLVRLYERTRPYEDSAVGMLLIDIDFFKSINDRFGHEAGDTVLRNLAAYFRTLEAEGCISGRMGGEEFVLAVHGLAGAALARLGERIRADIAALDHGAISRERPITASIGIAQGSGTTSFQKMYAAADRALYEAKHTGRNRVVFPASGSATLREEMERDQLSFAWNGRPPA
jgi:diguanylate cyclase (GGDEF)-like protein